MLLCASKVSIRMLLFCIPRFPLSMRIILYHVASCLVEWHWYRAYMEMLSNHVLPCLTRTLMPCFCLPWSCSISSLFHASNMSTCYFCSCMPCFSPSHNLCYQVACRIDHVGLILMPRNLNLNVIWSMLSILEVHIKFVVICFL